MKETVEQRKERIMKELQAEYPGKEVFDLNGNGLHFVCVVEPTEEHPEYDRAVEVMIKSRPHKHHKMKQVYTIIKGHLRLHLSKKIIEMKLGDTQTILPGEVHWAESEDECWDELYSTPGWTPEDHVPVEIEE